jgi:hypothetical protein
MKNNLKQRTKIYLEKRGGIVGNVEFWNRYSRRSLDLFGLFDQIAIFNHSIIGVQTTSQEHLKAHHEKMINNKNLFYWLDTDQPAWLITWKKKKIKRGGKKFKWIPQIREYYLMDFQEAKEEGREFNKYREFGSVIVWNDIKKDF